MLLTWQKLKESAIAALAPGMMLMASGTPLSSSVGVLVEHFVLTAFACCTGDANLLTWQKLMEPAIAAPPPGMKLTGFRDPFVIQRGGGGKPWLLIIGSGIKGKSHGTILLYQSDKAASGEDFSLLRPASWQQVQFVPAELLRQYAASCLRSRASLCCSW